MKEAMTMLTLVNDTTRPAIGARQLAEVIESKVVHLLDEAVDVVLAPWAIDFSHMQWSSSDETWM